MTTILVVRMPAWRRDRQISRGTPPLRAAKTIAVGLQDPASSEEGGAHRLHAEVADDSSWEAETSDALARGGGTPCLDRKTVADTLFFSLGDCVQSAVLV